MLVDIEVLRKQGGAHSREGRDKAPVKRLSRLFAHHYSLRPCACACTTTLQQLYSEPVFVQLYNYIYKNGHYTAHRAVVRSVSSY